MNSKLRNIVFGGVVISGCVALAGEAIAENRNLNASISVKEAYNTNVFFDVDNEVDDFVSTISPQLEYRQQTERMKAVLEGRLDGIIYADVNELNAVEQFYRGRIGYRVSDRADVSAEARFTKDSRPDRDLVIVEDLNIDEHPQTTGFVFGTNDRDRQTYKVSQGYKLTEKTSQKASYSYNKDTFDGGGSVDSTIQQVNLGFRHNLSSWMPLTTGRMDVNYSRSDSDASEIDDYSFTLGLERQLRELLRVFGDVGPRYSRADFNNSDEYDNWGVKGKVGASYRGETGVYNFVATHDVIQISGRHGATNRTSFVFSGWRQFTGEWRGTLTAGFYLNRSGNNEFSASAVDLTTLRVSPGLAYQFTDNMYIELADTYSTVKDEEENTTKDQNVVWLRLVLSSSVIE